MEFGASFFKTLLSLCLGAFVVHPLKVREHGDATPLTCLDCPVKVHRVPELRIGLKVGFLAQHEAAFTEDL